MLKKTFICMLFVLLGILSGSAGQWSVVPCANGTYTHIVETPKRVYYVTNQNLFHYDKDTRESYHYSLNNKLTGALVNDIQYNATEGYLLIVYSDANMDVLFDNGNIVSLPEIKQTVQDVSPAIKSVNMAPGYICVATNFGYALYDSKSLKVKESRSWPGQDVRAITVYKDQVLIGLGAELSRAPLADARLQPTDYKRLWSPGLKMLQVIGDYFYCVNASNELSGRTFDKYGYLVDPQDKIETGVPDTRRFNPTATGYTFSGAANLRNVGPDGKLTEAIALPASLQGGVASSWSGKSKVWVANKDGVGCYDLSGETPTVLVQPFHPQGTTCKAVAYITQSQDGERVYVTNSGIFAATHRRNGCGPESHNLTQTTDCINNGTVSNVNAKSWPRPNGDLQCHGIAVPSPFDSSVYFLCTRMNGVYVIKDGVVENYYYTQNSPMRAVWKDQTAYVAFDQFNNLLIYTGFTSMARVLILPADKVRDYKNVTAADWRAIDLLKFGQRVDLDGSLEVCRQSNVVGVVTQTSGQVVVTLIDTEGKADWTGTVGHSLKSPYIDQDGNKFEPFSNMCLEEDKLGRIWVGTTDGIIEITNPAEAIKNKSNNVVRLKVPRNDGSNFADYLLAGEQINAISTDHANRKWVATENSGLYLVSPNGDKILEHFTASNSPLPSNTVNTVLADSRSNMVYIGTPYGLVTYESDATPGAADLNNVNIYPNPVTPDYSGPVNVTGLMDGSMVKITDAAGNLVHQATSQGGMISWDVCNLGGERVRSGVYMIFATAGDNAEYSAVGKVVVIN